ncbi:hypothetical protein HJC23_010813 [Cyclotella cryptica]|uniref:Plastidal glycolate/glycerate translocator 1, chloroplastic n=1 Tax=Cyclotella cryptica TaxID=29204 RepID=A0ABD3QPK4_9STRA|eukprot:CCRYP_003557-RA/>CCRYP_003557-RA protein AED:0.04 eAED:0.04 QI:184/1/1/1/1/1/3/69/526
MKASKPLHIKFLLLALSIVGGSAFLATRSRCSPSHSFGVSVKPPTLAPLSSSRVHQLSRCNRTFVLSSAAKSASSSTSTSPAVDDTSNDTITATLFLIFMDTQLRSIFTKYSVAFPSSLAGCGFLFAFMILLDSLSGRDKRWGDAVYLKLNPGATLLAKWLPVFFVPSLITLPLASGLGSAYEVLKTFAVIIGGFFFTLFSTSFSVIWVRNIFDTKDSSVSDNPVQSTPTQSDLTTGKPPKPFSLALFRTLKSAASITGLLTVLSVQKFPSSRWIHPMKSLFLLFTTLSSFVFGANLPKSFTKIVHPLVTCTCLTWLAAKALASLTGSTFIEMLQSYKAGTLTAFSAGAGDILLFLLGPAVIALACQMYSRKKLMRENISTVGVSTLVSSLGGLYGTAAAVRFLRIINPTIRLSLLSRNITSPLAMAIASMLGADTSLAVTIVVLTGLFGANFGSAILDAAGIKDAVARGLGIGAAAHGLGTAAFSNEKDAFPFAAIAMALTASACTVLVSLPPVKRSVLNLALGM